MDIYKHIVVLRRLPHSLTIESIFAYDDYILIGTKNGHLLMYKLDIKTKTPSEYEIKTHLLRSEKEFSKRPIIQIQAIPEHRILVSLSDNIVSIHNLDKITFPLLSTLTKTKGATHFSLDVLRHKTLTGEIQYTVRLCVVVKYQLMFFYWKNNDFHELRPNVKLPDIAKTVAWYGKFLYVGLRAQYMQVSVESGKVKELFSILTEPLILSLASSSSNNVGVLGSGIANSVAGGGLALCREKETYIFDQEAKPLLDFPVKWSDQPISIADDSLFILAVLANDSIVEVLTTSNSKMVHIQRIALSVPSSGSTPSSITKPLKSITKWRSRPGQLVLHSDSDLILLKAVAREQQIKLLQSERYYDLALKIVELYSNDMNDLGPLKFDIEDDLISTATSESLNLVDPNETEKLKLRIRNLQAFDKFCRGDFKEAISIFQSLKTDPSYVIGLYPDLLPEEFCSRLNYPMKPPNFEGAILEQGLLVLIDYLLEVRRKIKDDISKLEAANRKPTADDRSKHIPKLAYPDLVKMQRIIDTSLLKCYLQTNDALVAPLLRIPDNHCHLEETEKALRKRQKYNELVILYRTKGLHRNALDLLQKQAKFNDDKNAAINRTKLIHYLQELGSEHLDLIFEYSEWILREHPNDGLEIFIDDSMTELDDATALPRELVLEYLETRIGNSSLVMQYLDHCIFVWKENRAKFHDSLINKYRERIRALMSEYQLESFHAQKLNNTIEIIDEQEMDLSVEDKNSSDFSERASFSSNREYHLRPEPAGQEPGELGLYRRQLMHLLRESDHYSTETLPTYLLHDGLFDERAIVMGKIGHHQEALIIYVHILQDLQRAEEYCMRHYNQMFANNKQASSSSAPITPTSPNGTSHPAKDVFLLLFQQCLKTPSVGHIRSSNSNLRSIHNDSSYTENDIHNTQRNQFSFQLSKSIAAYMQTHFSSIDSEFAKLFDELEPNVRVAIAILARHSTRIDLMRAIEMLPLELPLAALTTIMTQSMEHTTSRKNCVQILRQLLHAQRLRAHQARIRIERATRFVLTNADICQVCAKKISKSVFVRYINADLVHLGCREIYDQNQTN